MSDERGSAVLAEGNERPATEAAAPADEAEDLRRLRGLLEESDVEGARRFVKESAERWPESEEVQHYLRVLTPWPGRWVPGKHGRRMDKEFAWIREHDREYPGPWVAIYEDRLIAADPDLAVVLATVDRTPEAKGALLHRCPKRRD